MRVPTRVRLAAVCAIFALLGCGKAPEGTSTAATAGSETIVFSPPDGAALPNGQVGEVYSQTVTIASGGTAPFELSALEVPEGLAWSSVSPSGTVTGTPTLPGSTRLKVAVTDARKATALATYTIEVEGGGSLTILPANLPNGTVGTLYSATLVAVGAVPPCTWLIRGAPPPGLNLVTTVGETSVEAVLSGAPTASGTTTFVVTVTDSANPPHTGTANFTFVVP